MTSDPPSTVAGCVRRWAAERPDGLALAGDDERLTWADYDRLSDALADHLAATVEPGQRVATWVPDGPSAHVAWLALEKAGITTVGIGWRAGPQEVAHLLARSGASAILAPPDVRVPAGTKVLSFDIGNLGPGGGRGRHGLGPEDAFILNSTSGTTGLPKLVIHTQRRWFYFHELAVAAGGLRSDEVFCSALPGPYGFGLWTQHFTPAILGSPVHIRRRFVAEDMIGLIEREGVTVLAAVTTQLILLLDSPALAGADLSRLRAVFTGGEAVPYAKAAEFEERTGAKVLQFYGSNETGAASVTTLEDDRQHRLTTAGRIIPGMQVRLFDPETRAPIGIPGRGQPACRGPATCEGYWDDPVGNTALYTDDGWMLMGDLVEIDGRGYLTVVGRTSDVVIRGGKNISAPAVEAEVMTHPSVSVAAVVAVPDPVFGERVGVFVEMKPGAEPVTLEDLIGHLRERGVSREWFPEHLLGVGSLPRSSGGKIAKGDLRKQAVAFGT
ncbi:MAG TPA: class I adenylate-forming enzyme family protein [Acidimicrobiales bacterium]|jgi:acyl-CoA synthetase|nr:class I adenylate-forming enzyme family protein [Acidimicrobiales bacterium]